MTFFSPRRRQLAAYSRTERELINARRGNAHKLGLALHIGFLRLSGRLLNSVRIVPASSMHDGAPTSRPGTHPAR